MKAMVSRQMYLRALKKKLRFRYNIDDIDSIMDDYNEIFDIETAQGKTEEDVCMSLGDPAIIAQNLYKEMHSRDDLVKKIFIKSNVLQGIFIIMICAITVKVIATLVYGQGKSIMSELLVSYPFTVLLLWLALKRRISSAVINKNYLVQITAAHLICFSIVISLFLFFNYINLNIEQAGIIVERSLFILIALLCGMILFSFFKIVRNQIAYHSVIYHVLGVIAIILYYINVLHTLTTVSLFSRKVLESGYIYLETIIVLIVNLFLHFKGRHNNGCTVKKRNSGNVYT